MRGPTPVDLAGAAQAALADGDWPAARAAYEAWVEEDPAPEALFGLGDVLWWLGETPASLDCQQRAYAGFRQRGDHAGAAMTAVNLYLTYRASVGATTVARGWLSRAARLVEAAGTGAGQQLAGWLALLRAHDSADPVVAERWATEAHEAAGAAGDADLELCALSQLGAAVVQQGRLADGTALLDEAMAAALAGEARRPHTVVYVSCNLISSCAEWAEFEHVLQWIRAADAFEQRYGNAHLHTTCRLHLGAIQLAVGDWQAAERQLRAALDAGTTAEPDLAAEAAARLAELRLAQGRLEEAERLLEGWPDRPSCVGALARIAVARGDFAHAHHLVRRLTRALDAGDLASGAGYRPGLSGPLAEAAVWETLAASARGPEAEAAVRRLEVLAEETGCAQLQACALATAGRVRGDLRSLEGALSLYTRLRLPFAAARTRLVLAGQLVGDEAVAEARAALAAFEALGAARDADAAAARLRELGVSAARGGPIGLGELTQREREVLALLGEGLTNRELADRLFLSRKTVERHVRNVLFKLGLRNRAEAAAYVVRHGAEIRSTG